MEDAIKVGDVVRLASGKLCEIKKIDKFSGLYLINDVIFHRFEFELVKWNEDQIGHTGIGVCAKGV